MDTFRNVFITSNYLYFSMKMDQNINDFAKTLFQAHQNPIRKLNIRGVKIYIPKNDDNKPTNNNLNVLKDALSFPRVEKIIMRSRGIFLQQKRLILIERLHNLQNVGFRDKTGMYFHLEEALYFLETNRLEILWNKTPISIQQAYNLFIDDILTLDKYRVYNKFMSHGFKVEKFKENDQEPDLKKPKLIDHTKEAHKSGEKVSKNNEKITEIIKRLKEKAPKEVDGRNFEQNPDYFCINPRETNLNNKYNVHLVKQEMDPKIAFYNENVQNLFAIASNDSICLYKISKVSLPNLFE